MHVLYALVSCGVEVRVSSNLPPPSVSLRAPRSFIRPDSTDIRLAMIRGWVSGGLSEVRGVAASLAANGMGFPHSVNRQGIYKAGDNGQGTRTGIYKAHVDQRAAHENVV